MDHGRCPHRFRRAHWPLHHVPARVAPIYPCNAQNAVTFQQVVLLGPCPSEWRWHGIGKPTYFQRHSASTNSPPSTITSTFNSTQCSSSSLASRQYYKKMAIRTCSSNHRRSRSSVSLHTLLAQKSRRWWRLLVMFYLKIHYQWSAISVFLAVGTVSAVHPVSKFCF